MKKKAVSKVMKKKEVSKGFCCHGGNFPTFAIIVLFLGVFWLLSDLKMITTGIPWLPIIMIIVAVGWIIGHKKKE